VSGVRLDLANPNTYSSPKEYIEKHLAPIATELHRLANEMIAPGASSEEWSTDMVPSHYPGDDFSCLDARLHDVVKHVTFDGSEYFSIPKELLRAKQLKVQFQATVFVSGGGKASFRLVRDSGDYIDESLFIVEGEKPQTVSRILPFSDDNGSIKPSHCRYFIQGGRVKPGSRPVCRRFSLSFVYL